MSLLIRRKSVLSGLVWMLVAVVLAVALDYGLLRAVYNPEVVLEGLVQTFKTIWKFIPGSELFRLTHSPTAVLLFTVIFWATVTTKNFLPRAYVFLGRVRKCFKKAVSITFVSGIASVALAVLLYQEIKNGGSELEILFDLSVLQISVYTFIRCMRKFTIPAIKTSYDKMNIHLDEMEQVRQGNINPIKTKGERSCHVVQ